MPKCKLPQHRCLKKEIYKTDEACELHEDAKNNNDTDKNRDVKDTAEGMNEKCKFHKE